MTDITWKNETWKLKDLKFWDQNPRTMSEQQDDLLETSILEGGVFQVPVVNADGTIIAGHQRVRKLIELGFDTVECRIASRLLTDAEYRELNIRDNKNTGVFDYEALKGEFSSDTLMTEFGFTEAQLENPFQEEKQPEGNEEKEDAVAKAKEAFDSAENKQIVLVVPQSEYEELVDKISALMEHYQLEKPAEVVALLIRTNHENLPKEKV